MPGSMLPITDHRGPKAMIHVLNRVFGPAWLTVPRNGIRHLGHENIRAEELASALAASGGRLHRVQLHAHVAADNGPRRVESRFIG